uniref:Cytochrome c oxidase subunit 3 n=1 Tax=Ammophila sabulosa TaxID=1088610 RepID=A0A7L7S768_9HYME|nr:cytochrome c oxidase subunit III [Ammophila sabulosa]
MSHNHPFHMVQQSPWPILTSMSILNLAISTILWFHYKNYLMLLISLMSLMMCLMLWWRDVIRESTFQGCHTLMVQKNIRMGMMLFIVSEAFFFLSFFWTYFHMALSPSIEIGAMWPPKGIILINPYKIPLLNTLLLISSGFTITWSHYSMMINKKSESLISLLITIMLGIIFSSFQMYEYYMCPFTISDSVFGSIFFIATGFHGIHVLIGTTFLMVCLIRMKFNHFSKNRHLGFEMASWYWHFVDIIWLLLYISIYWWIF